MNKAEIKRILATWITADVGATIEGFEIASEKIADFAEKEAIEFNKWIDETIGNGLMPHQWYVNKYNEYQKFKDNEQS